MIPINLKIKGLYSYLSEQEIDFSALTSAGLFGVFGRVGSGKSSIIEAITFALYGRTTRLNQTGDNRYYNMMNLKSDRLLIDFEFRSGSPEKQFRAVVSGRRNSKRFGDVNAFDRQTYIKTGDEWIPVEQTIIEDAIGLSFENFKRCIIIPQGQFQEFLSLSKTDRTQMLKELFQLQRFDLFNRVRSLENQCQMVLQKLEGRKQELGEADEERMKLLREEIAEHKNQKEILEKELLELRPQEQWQAALKEDDLLRQNLEKTQQSLLRQKPEIDQREQKLAVFEECSTRFGTLFARSEDAEKSLQEVQKKLHTFRKERDDLLKQLHLCTNEFNQAKIAFEGIEKIQTEIIALKHYQKALESKKQAETLNTQIAKGEKFLIEEVQKKSALLKTQLDSLKSIIKELEQGQADLAKLRDIQNWYIYFQKLLKQEKELVFDEQRIDDKILEMEQKKWTYIKEGFISTFPSIATDNPSEKIVEQSVAEGDKIKVEIDTLNEKRNKLAIEQNLEHLANSLEEGKACPLCGSNHHPKKLDCTNVAVQIKQVDQQIATNKEKLEQLEFVCHKLNNIILGKQLKIGSLQKIKENGQKLDSEIAAHKKGFIWNDYDISNSLTVDKQIKQANIQLEQITQKRNERDQFETQIIQLIDQENRAKAKINAYKQELSACRASIEENMNNVATYAEAFKEKTAAELNQRENDLAKFQIQIRDKYQRLEKTKSKLTAEYNIKEGLITANTNSSNELEEHLKAINAQIEGHVIEGAYESKQQAYEILKSAINVSAERQEINRFHTQFSTVKTRLLDVNSRLKGRRYDAEQHKSLMVQLTEKEKSLKLQSTKLAEKELIVKEELRKEDSRKKLHLEISDAQKRSENLALMKRLFKAQGFVHFVSGAFLRNICQQANQRFRKLTGQRLSLELNDDSMFVVRDFLNNGHTRNIKTLSGGQMFQASLSLALALSDNVQAMSGSTNRFFFMDEGFGSLDKESLHIVFDTLRSLKQENRIVGVISHVEELQQDIGVYLNIEMDEKTGSHIKAGWE